MSRVFFEELALPEPRHNLEVGSGSHGWQLGEMVKKVEQVLVDEKPAGVLVYGDTNSTLAGALAAAKLHVPVAHVEAGLRSFNRRMPEEVNRVLTDHVASLLFAPTTTAVANLTGEGITRGVHHTGDVMADVLRSAAPRLGATAQALLGRLGISGRYVVATIHRAENTDDRDRLQAILAGLRESPVPVIFPIHPRTRARTGDGDLGGSLRAIEPLGYVSMLALLSRSAGVITDSGGVQKEACLLGVPCATARDETEWTETVAAGWNRLVAANRTSIAKVAGEFGEGTAKPDRSLDHEYGTGQAAGRIVGILKENWIA
jgi:UDP-GlcNAc3NAcA epimerase